MTDLWTDATFALGNANFSCSVCRIRQLSVILLTAVKFGDEHYDQMCQFLRVNHQTPLS